MVLPICSLELAPKTPVQYALPTSDVQRIFRATMYHFTWLP